MKKRFRRLLTALCVLLLLGCAPTGGSGGGPLVSGQTRQDPQDTPESAGESLVLTVGDRDFAVTLEDTPAARAFAQRLPLTAAMSELNGNEKYFYMEQGLPTAATEPGDIQAGDLMLYGADCLVLFYEGFASPYAYTRLGRVADAQELAKALGDGDVEVTFQGGMEAYKAVERRWPRVRGTPATPTISGKTQGSSTLS